MEFEFKGQQYRMPVLLSEITVAQRIAFYKQYGKDLDARAQAINGIKDVFDKDIARTEWAMENAVKTFSFYTGIPLEVVQGEMNYYQMLAIYNTDMHSLYEQERDIKLLPSYEWMGETWVIAAPELKGDSEMTFNEFLCAKEITRQMHAIGNGQWDALPYLCAIYLRKQGEPYTEALIGDKGERLKLMQELPLDIALAVGFFLSSTMNAYKKVSASFSLQNQEESILPATSTDGAG